MGSSDSFSILGDRSISFITQDEHSAYKHIFGLENLKATQLFSNGHVDAEIDERFFGIFFIQTGQHAAPRENPCVFRVIDLSVEPIANSLVGTLQDHYQFILTSFASKVLACCPPACTTSTLSR